jgi:methionyl-tRNA formyltransferase
MTGGSRKILVLASKRLGLRALETVEQCAPGTVAAVATIDDLQDTRSAAEGIRRWCNESSTPLHVLGVRAELESVLDRVEPDLCLVVGWYWLLDSGTLARVPGGFVGVHSSLLPKYRGGAPLVWTLLNGDPVGGVSLFYFDAGMDSGDLIGQREFPIGADDTIADASARVEECALDLLRVNVPALLEGRAPRVRQRHDLATYGSQRRPGDGLLDWTAPAHQVHNAIRAQTHPYPGAFTFLRDGTKLTCWRASLFPCPYFGLPGRVVGVEEGRAVVTCGTGSVYLHQVQRGNDDEVEAASLLRPGMTLGRTG